MSASGRLEGAERFEPRIYRHSRRVSCGFKPLEANCVAAISRPDRVGRAATRRGPWLFQAQARVQRSLPWARLRFQRAWRATLGQAHAYSAAPAGMSSQTVRWFGTIRRYFQRGSSASCAPMPPCRIFWPTPFGARVREGTDLLQSFGDKSLKIGEKLSRPVGPSDARAFRVYELLQSATIGPPV